MKEYARVVIGDGWPALAAVAGCAENDLSVAWLPGSGANIIAPVPYLDSEEAARNWGEILGWFLGDAYQRQDVGTYLREFKNKSFVQPEFEDLSQEVFGPEKWMAGLESPQAMIRPDLGFEHALNELKHKLLKDPNVTRWESIPVRSIREEADKVVLALSDNEILETKLVVLADKPSELLKIQGLPKNLTWQLADSESQHKERMSSWVDKHQPLSTLQILLKHRFEVGKNVQECFSLVTPKDVEDTRNHRVWGYFLAEGSASVWTTVLTSKEAEDNHLIGKKLRRIKQTLNKVFSEQEWFSDGTPECTAKEFTDTIESENVRLEEEMLFAKGSFPQAQVHWGSRAIYIPDGFGPGVSVQARKSVVRILSENKKDSGVEAEAQA